MELYEDLKWRGLVDNISDDALIKALNEDLLTFYIGIDPTGSSLHIGHLCSLLTALRLQLKGHQPLIIIGGATGLIGDPKPQAERPMIELETVKTNIEQLKVQLKKIIKGKIINNYDWHGAINFIQFLRDYGKHFNLNYMLNKDVVKRRLEVGITYTEFSYLLLQAVDFLKLYEKYNCSLQIGGQDQWGNITAGLELIRKKHPGSKAYGLTIPLITKTDGSKFGKTETGTIWLDQNLTSPYALYQFFLNTEDDNVISYLKKFTFLNKEEILSLEGLVREQPAAREAQKVLGQAVVTIIHGEEAYQQALKITNSLFKHQVKSLTEKEIKMAMADVPTTIIDDQLELVLALIKSGIAPSKRAARELIINGAIIVNDQKETNDKFVLAKKEALYQQYFIIRKGKKQYFCFKLKDKV